MHDAERIPAGYASIAPDGWCFVSAWVLQRQQLRGGRHGLSTPVAKVTSLIP
jgi:hypothetical protein